MKKQLTLLVATSSMISLTACTIESKNNNPSTATTGKPTTTVVSPPTTANNPSGTTPNNNSGNANQAKRDVTGEAFDIGYTFTYDNKKAVAYSKDGSYKPTTYSNDEHTVNIDGRKFAIMGNSTPNGHRESMSSLNGAINWVRYDTYDVTYSVGDYRHVRYGNIMDFAPDNQKHYSFYHGIKTPTANIPNTGKINYVGHSIHNCMCDNGGSLGTAQFTADFDKKTITGSVKNAPNYEQNRAYNLALNATISGNTFSGTNKDGIETKGAFFGDKLQEMGGIYKDKDSKFIGTFGGIKQ